MFERTYPSYVGLLDHVVILVPPVLPKGFVIRHPDDIEQAALSCGSHAWVLAITDILTAPEDSEEGNWFQDRLRRLMRAAHLALRTAGVGGVSITAELVLYESRDKHDGVHWRNVCLRYRTPWGDSGRADVGPFHFDTSVERRLTQYFSSSTWQPDKWDQLDPLFRFADAIYRYYDKDRFVDYYLCMEALIVPEGSKAPKVKGVHDGRLGNAFCHRAARFIALVDDEGCSLVDPHPCESDYQDVLRRLYALRCSILHGDTKASQKSCLKKLDLELEPSSWTALAQMMETYTRRLVRFFLNPANVDVDQRKKYWQDTVDPSLRAS